MRVRTNLFKGDKIIWQDAASDDYIHRPNNEELEGMCSYEMTKLFKKTCKTFKQMENIISSSASVEDDDDEDDLSYEDISEFDCFNG